MYVFSGNGAETMWLMCIPPLVGWFGLAWIICTHERVTCFNYQRLLARVDVHGLDQARRESLWDKDGDGEEDVDAAWENAAGGLDPAA